MGELRGGGGWASDTFFVTDRNVTIKSRLLAAMCERRD